MRLPYIQVAEWSRARARDMAHLLDVQRQLVCGQFEDLTEWMLSRVLPDGVFNAVIGPRAGKLIEGAVEWEGPEGAWIEAAVEVGVLVRVDGGYDFSPVFSEPYVGVLKRRQAAAQRQKKARERHKAVTQASRVTDAKVDAKTETETERKTETESVTALQRAAPVRPTLESLDLIRRFAEIFERVVGGPYVSDQQADLRALGRLNAHTKGMPLDKSRAEMFARWERGLRATYRRTMSLADLARPENWNHHAIEASTTGRKDASDLPPMMWERDGRICIDTTEVARRRWRAGELLDKDPRAAVSR